MDEVSANVMAILGVYPILIDEGRKISMARCRLRPLRCIARLGSENRSIFVSGIVLI